MNSVWLASNGYINSIELRDLNSSDVPKVKQLCSDWFPIEYPDSWYEEITTNKKFISKAAVYDSEIVGLIVVETKSQDKCNREDKGLLATSLPKDSEVAYILTLGVVKEHRRNGIASLLLDKLIKDLIYEPKNRGVKAVYLHVLTTNIVAIRFYENRQFKRHLYLPLYYSINSTARDGFSYVLYINGGRPQPTLLDYIAMFLETISQIAATPCRWPKRLFLMITSGVFRYVPISSRRRRSSPYLATL
ncbi:N-alpha-acetyltransferase 60-like [Oppia nitens]|uniref:N-alpha-acetyltransferase 60-like n=1 Tax=Oppia nitens TaxID=1686743 RepID=UPI0023DBD7EF|nr:N-alpha-acetyltransferase 60-like [Oppia nitens]